MISEIKVYGDPSTTWHNFTITSEVMTITVSAGEYWRGGEKLAELEGPASVEIHVAGEFEVWLTDAGTIDLQEIGGDLTELAAAPLDRLAWLSVPPGSSKLDDVQINVVRIEVEP